MLIATVIVAINTTIIFSWSLKERYIIEKYHVPTRILLGGDA